MNHIECFDVCSWSQYTLEKFSRGLPEAKFPKSVIFVKKSFFLVNVKNAVRHKWKINFEQSVILLFSIFRPEMIANRAWPFDVAFYSSFPFDFFLRYHYNTKTRLTITTDEYTRWNRHTFFLLTFEPEFNRCRRNFTNLRVQEKCFEFNEYVCQAFWV